MFKWQQDCLCSFHCMLFVWKAWIWCHKYVCIRVLCVVRRFLFFWMNLYLSYITGHSCIVVNKLKLCEWTVWWRHFGWFTDVNLSVDWRRIGTRRKTTRGGATILKVGGGQILRAERIIPKLCPPVRFGSKSGGHVPAAPKGAPPMKTTKDDWSQRKMKNSDSLSQSAPSSFSKKLYLQLSSHQLRNRL